MLDRLEMLGHAMINRMNQMEVVTNNLANINTRGFKRDQIFVNALKEELQALGYPDAVDEMVPQTGSTPDFSQGALAGTNRVLDVAISGDGLFAVEAPQGEVYTRDGRFTVNQEGILTNQDGLAVVGQGGPIELDMQQYTPKDIIINDQGEILMDGNIIDVLKIVSIQNPNDFVKIGGNLFTLAENAGTPPLAENVVVKQQFLEESNVNPVEEMVTMMEIFHLYETGQRLLRAQDQTLNRTVNDIGRVA
jgi:flagellar basal-body rod protein FlgG